MSEPQSPQASTRTISPRPARVDCGSGAALSFGSPDSLTTTARIGLSYEWLNRDDAAARVATLAIAGP